MPDVKIDSDWEHAGLRCITVDCRGWRTFMPAGSHNGYVMVPESHPWHGREYNEPAGWLKSAQPLVPGFDKWSVTEPQNIIRVHGGLTYSGRLLGDDGGWWFGFDTAHHGDTPEICDHVYVVAQCERLASQLAEVTA